MQNHGIWHLQELRDSSFIIGIKAENTVANAENRRRKIKKSGCYTVRIVIRWNIRRFRQRSSSESQMGTGF